MPRALQLVVLAWCTNAALGLVCYNCSTTHADLGSCAGDFAPPNLPFNTTNKLANCSEENTMCFVRSWRARARHAWIVQRGCYQSAGAGDQLVQLLNKPTRAMTCTNRRLAEAEYKVCLCQSNWCNSTSTNLVSKHFLVCILIILYVISFLFRGYIVDTTRRGPFFTDVSL